VDNIDLHSLKVLNTIFETGSLSHTAARLEVSQPAVSITLSKLRKHFDDPLFVRIGTRMQPTRQALGIIGNVQASIAAMEATLNYRIAFDPKTAHRNFTISMTDIGQIVMLPKLLNELEKRAPNCTLNVTKLTENTSRLLETGEVDLAVGFSPHIAAGLYQQVLFTENFVCLIRRKHPRIRNQIAKEQYRTESHMVVVTSVTSHLIIDKALDKEGVQRKVMIRVPNFLGLAPLIAATDCICTLPRRAGLILAEHPQIRATPVPFKLPAYAVRQLWHERQARDPGNRWFRGVMMNLFRAR
jgi:DNA-binding transcriptional LysR family regulator